MYLGLAEGRIAGRILGAHRDGTAEQASAADAAGERGVSRMQRGQEWHLSGLYSALLSAKERLVSRPMVMILAPSSVLTVAYTEVYWKVIFSL